MKRLISLPLFLGLASCHTSPEQQRANLQEVADQACACERSGHLGCWDSFNRSLPAGAEGDPKPNGGETLCAPISAQIYTWTLNGKEFDVTTRRYALLSKPPDVILCSASEAATAEQLLGSSYLTHTAAAEKAEQAVRAIPLGKTELVRSKPTCG
jgi:hypothetical protein